jgi:perosamine synthetase
MSLDISGFLKEDEMDMRGTNLPYTGSGDRAGVYDVPFNNPLITEEDINAVTACLKSGNISTSGKATLEFEQAFSSYLGGIPCVALFSGTAAIHLSMFAAGLKPGEGVIVPSLTYVSSVSPVLHAGGVPFFADSDIENYNIDPDSLGRWIEDSTFFDGKELIHRSSGTVIKALMVVHLFGNAVPMEKFKRIASSANLTLIEDAAQSLGALSGDSPVGTIGDMGCFSFNGNKMITSAAGGMFVSRNELLIEKVAELSRPYGTHDDEAVPGFNYRMPSMCASLGLSQLDRLETHLEHTRSVYEEYRNELKDLPGVSFPKISNAMGITGWAVPIRIHSKSGGPNRDSLVSALVAEGIEARPGFKPLHKT